MNAVDTNIFVYSLDDDEPVKQAKAKSLLSRLFTTPSQTLVPWQVAGELLNHLRKWENAGRITSQDVESNFRNVIALFPLAVPTIQTHRHYFDLYSRFSLSHWDAML